MTLKQAVTPFHSETTLSKIQDKSNNNVNFISHRESVHKISFATYLAKYLSEKSVRSTSKYCKKRILRQALQQSFFIHQSIKQSINSVIQSINVSDVILTFSLRLYSKFAVISEIFLSILTLASHELLGEYVLNGVNFAMVATVIGNARDLCWPRYYSHFGLIVMINAATNRLSKL